MIRSADLQSAPTIVRSEVQAIEPDIVVWRLMPLETWMEQSRWGHRVFGTMFTVFSVIALVLSAVGIYAVTAYSVVERTKEIGIRMALGARAGRVMALFVRRRLPALGAGLALGMGGAFGVGRLVRSMLVQTSPTDALTLTSLGGLLAGVAMLAVVVPALRASGSIPPSRCGTSDAPERFGRKSWGAKRRFARIWKMWEFLPARKIFEIPLLTRTRIRSAYAVGAITDGLQLILGPFGWAFADEVLDVAAMILISRLIGFHALLLPTFVLELVPLADLLPTWTASVALVLSIRKRQAPEPAPPGNGPVIDV